MLSNACFLLIAVLASLVFPSSTVPAAAPAIAVTSFTLMNADTDEPIGTLVSNQTLNLAQLPTRRLNIRANTNPSQVGSVRFGLDGNASYRVQNGAPYTLANDNNGDYFPWTPSAGQHTLTATPYSEMNAAGSAGTKLEIKMPVVDTPVQESSTDQRIYGALFGDTRYLESDWDAGMRVREVELSWRRYEPSNGSWDADFIGEKRWEFKLAREAGFQLVLDFGMHYPPTWAKQLDPWKDQYGNTHTAHVNAVWSPQVRQEIEQYIARVFADFGTDFLGVRLGSGGWVETMYPPTPAGYKHSYWAFDSEAIKSYPVPGWRPGQPSPNGEARQFYEWYLGKLINMVSWQQSVVRRHYDGKLLQLFAGIGVRPEGYEDLIADNLIPQAHRIGVDAAERGVVIDRIIAGMDDKSNVVIVSSSLGDGFATAPWVDELSADPMKWSSAHWVAYNARVHGLPRWGENTGNDDYANMQIVFKQMKDFGYSGLFWAWDYQLYDGRHASIDDYARLIRQYR